MKLKALRTLLAEARGHLKARRPAAADAALARALALVIEKQHAMNGYSANSRRKKGMPRYNYKGAAARPKREKELVAPAGRGL